MTFYLQRQSLVYISDRSKRFATTQKVNRQASTAEVVVPSARVMQMSFDTSDSDPPI